VLESSARSVEEAPLGIDMPAVVGVQPWEWYNADVSKQVI